MKKHLAIAAALILSLVFLATAPVMAQGIPQGARVGASKVCEPAIVCSDRSVVPWAVSSAASRAA